MIPLLKSETGRATTPNRLQTRKALAMTSRSEYQKNAPVVDMRPARFFRSLTTRQLIEHIQFAGTIIARDAAEGESSLIEYVVGLPPMHVRSYERALKFELNRREYHAGVTPIDAGNGGAA
jgi:hypothetical protein